MSESMSEEQILEAPVLIVGSPRSGTSFLGEMLKADPRISYLGEPRLVWKHGNETHSDALRGKHATPEVIHGIRSRLASMAREAGGERLVDKTPQNALRLEFIDQVFPDSRFIHLIRDGESAVLSIRDNWLKSAGTRDPKAVMRRLKEMDIRRAHHYVREAFQRFLPKQLGQMAGRVVWGPHLPGIQGMLSEMELIEVCCLQWRWSVESACQYGRKVLPADRYRELRLEEMNRDTIEDLLSFAEIESSEPMWDYFERRFRPSKTGAHVAGMTDREAYLMDQWLSPTQQWLDAD